MREISTTILKDLIISPAEPITFIFTWLGQTGALVRMPMPLRTKVKPRVISNLPLDLSQKLFIYSKRHISQHPLVTPNKQTAGGKQHKCQKPQWRLPAGHLEVRTELCLCRAVRTTALLISLPSTSLLDMERTDQGPCLHHTPKTQLSLPNSHSFQDKKQADMVQLFAHVALESLSAMKCSRKPRKKCYSCEHLTPGERSFESSHESYV